MSDSHKPIKSGLGGWLIFVGLSLLVSLLNPLFLWSDWDLITAYRGTLNEHQSQVFSLQMLFALFQWFFNLYLVKLFFSKSVRFPFLFIVFCALPIAPVMAFLLTQVPSPSAIGLVSLPVDTGSLPYPPILAVLPLPLLYFVIPTLYMLRSKRVKATFSH